MRAKAYRGSQSKDLILLLPADEPQNPARLPGDVRARMGDLDFWKDVDLSDRKLIGVNPAEAERNLRENGYHVQQTTVFFEEG